MTVANSVCMYRQPSTGILILNEMVDASWRFELSKLTTVNTQMTVRLNGHDLVVYWRVTICYISTNSPLLTVKSLNINSLFQNRKTDLRRTEILSVVCISWNHFLLATPTAIKGHYSNVVRQTYPTSLTVKGPRLLCGTYRMIYH